MFFFVCVFVYFNYLSFAHFIISCPDAFGDVCLKPYQTCDITEAISRNIQPHIVRHDIPSPKQPVPQEVIPFFFCFFFTIFKETGKKQLMGASFTHRTCLLHFCTHSFSLTEKFTKKTFFGTQVIFPTSAIS